MGKIKFHNFWPPLENFRKNSLEKILPTSMALSAVFCSGFATWSADIIFVTVTHCKTTSNESACSVMCMLCQQTSPVEIELLNDVSNFENRQQRII